MHECTLYTETEMMGEEHPNHHNDDSDEELGEIDYDIRP